MDGDFMDALLNALYLVCEQLVPIVLTVLLIMLCIQRKRNKKVLTVNYRCKTWYLLFSTDEGFVFSTSKKQREYNQDLHELQYFKKDQIFKHFSGYVDISKDDSKKD